jgi:hypothetical protein
MAYIEIWPSSISSKVSIEFWLALHIYTNSDAVFWVQSTNFKRSVYIEVTAILHLLKSDNKRERKKKPISKSIRAISADNILQQLYLEKIEEIYLDSEGTSSEVSGYNVLALGVFVIFSTLKQFRWSATTTAGIVDTAWNCSFSYSIQSSSNISIVHCHWLEIVLIISSTLKQFRYYLQRLLALSTLAANKVLNLFYFKQFRWHLAWNYSTYIYETNKTKDRNCKLWNSCLCLRDVSYKKISSCYTFHVYKL